MNMTWNDKKGRWCMHVVIPSLKRKYHHSHAIFIAGCAGRKWQLPVLPVATISAKRHIRFSGNFVHCSTSPAHIIVSNTWNTDLCVRVCLAISYIIFWNRAIGEIDIGKMVLQRSLVRYTCIRVWIWAGWWVTSTNWHANTDFYIWRWEFIFCFHGFQYMWDTNNSCGRDAHLSIDCQLGLLFGGCRLSH